MVYHMTNTKIPNIIYDNHIHIIKCIENNTPIKRSIRKEIYKWMIGEIAEHKCISKEVFICVMVKAMAYSISDDICNSFIMNFNLNNVKQNIFPELNIIKVKYYTKKHNIEMHECYAWFDGVNYDARINILNHCIDTINKNIERERLKKRVVYSTGEQQ